MLRLVLSRSRSALPALSRGFATHPVKPATNTAADRRLQDSYYVRITRKYPRVWGKSLPLGVLDRTVEFLENRGFSKTKALQTISKHTGLTNYTIDMMNRKIDYFSAMGLTHDKINDIIMRSPNILGASFDKLRILENWYIQHGVAPEKIPFVYNVFPNVATNSIERNLNTKVEFLKNFGCTDVQIARLLTLGPQIFSLSIDRMQVTINFLLKVGLSREKLPGLIARCPMVLALKLERIQESLDAVEDMFGEGTGLTVLQSHFRIVMYNVDGIRQSFDFLVSLGFTPDRIMQNTQFIVRSVSGILRPRARFLEEQGVDMIHEIDWIRMSDRFFIQRYPSYAQFLQQYKEQQMIAVTTA